MSRKSLIGFLSLLVIFCIIGSVAYYRRALSGTITSNTGSAVFNVSGFTEVNESKTIALKDGLIVPGDKVFFDIVMDANGSDVDMYVSLRIERINLPENLKFYTSSDYKSELHTYYSYLKTNSETLTIDWYWNPYIDDTKDSEFINSGNLLDLDASIVVSVVQVNEYAMMKIYSSSSDVNGGTEFWSDTYRPYIRTINFGNDLSNMLSSCTEENLCFDISYDANQNKKVYGYLVDSDLTISEIDSSTSTNVEKTLYDLYIVSEAPIFVPVDCNYIFNDFKSLIQINFNNNFNTSKATNISNMFSNCISLISLDLSSFNTSNVTNMYGMFCKCSKLKTTINIMNVNDYNYIFFSAATNANAQITVNYISDASDLVNSMIATKSSSSNVVKGNQI